MAMALEGLHEAYKQHFRRLHQERGEIRKAAVATVPTRDDHIREAQGASCRTIEDCPSGPEETEDGERENDIGVRKREWLETNR
jgi:hypothetical protein